jgi:hypothetical protein
MSQDSAFFDHWQSQMDGNSQKDKHIADMETCMAQEEEEEEEESEDDLAD